MKGRYQQVQHKTLKVNDLVLIKDDYTKSVNYPLGKVKQIVVNDIGEVTGAIIQKG